MGSEDIAIIASGFRRRGRSGVIGLTRCSGAHVMALTCAIAIFGGPSAFASERVVADLDGDGVRDHVSLSHRDPTILRVWLSSTRRVDIIRSREPIQHIAAADLDGDAHADLIARVPSSLRVWVRRSGHFQAYRSRHRTIVRRLSRARNHASNADPLCAELSATDSLAAPSLESIVLALPSPRIAWTEGTNPVRGPTSRTAVHPFTPRPPPLS